MNRRNFAKSIGFGFLSGYVPWFVPTKSESLVNSDIKRNDILYVWNQNFNVTPITFLNSKKIDLANTASVREFIRNDFARECTINYQGTMFSETEFALVALLHN